MTYSLPYKEQVFTIQMNYCKTTQQHYAGVKKDRLKWVINQAFEEITGVMNNFYKKENSEN